MVKPKKSFGQHFLTDHSVVERTVSACREIESNQVVEIGPGEGVLTIELLRHYDNLTVVEVDRESIAHLRQEIPQLGKNLIEADVLKWQFPKGEWLVVGNFPYNISTQIVFKAIENRDKVLGLVGMFQKEVAERIVSPPGSKVYGILSVLTQAFFKAEYLFTVEADAFRPPPKVKSGVIRLVRKEDFEIDCDVSFLFSIVKQTFNQRRKMLRNTLKPFVIGRPTAEVEYYLTQRPEQLHYEDFIKLARLLKP